MDKEEVLRLETRRKIYDLISSAPGIHLREIARRSDLQMGELEYHLATLEEQGLIVTKKDGYYVRYFAKGKMSVMEKNIISLLRQNNPRNIVVHLFLHPNSCNKDILTELDIPSSTLSYYLRKLVKAEILVDEVRGRNTYFAVKDPELVIKLLTTYRSSFFDEMVNRLIDLWDRIY